MDKKILSEKEEIRDLLKEIKVLLQEGGKEDILDKYESKKKLLTERLDRYYQSLKEANLTSERLLEMKDEIISSLSSFSEKSMEWAKKEWQDASEHLAPAIQRYSKAAEEFIAHKVTYPDDVSVATPEEIDAGVTLESRYQIQWRRKIWHMTSGSVIFLLYQILGTPKLAGLIVFAIYNTVIISADLLRLKRPDLNARVLKEFSKMIRREEASRMNAMSFYGISCFLTILFFSKPIAVLAILYLAFGDTAASVVGIKYGRIRITEKATVLGSLSFFAVCLVITLLYQLFFGAVVERWFLFALLGSLGAAVIEIIPVRINDNLTIPVFSALILAILTRLF